MAEKPVSRKNETVEVCFSRVADFGGNCSPEFLNTC
jgi:hypothetical protein